MSNPLPGSGWAGPVGASPSILLEETVLISDADDADLPIETHPKSEIYGTDKDSWAEIWPIDRAAGRLHVSVHVLAEWLALPGLQGAGDLSWLPVLGRTSSWLAPSIASARLRMARPSVGGRPPVLHPYG